MRDTGLRRVQHSPGRPATVSLWDVGRCLCVPPFRMVCLYQAWFCLVVKKRSLAHSSQQRQCQEQELRLQNSRLSRKHSGAGIQELESSKSSWPQKRSSWTFCKAVKGGSGIIENTSGSSQWGLIREQPGKLGLMEDGGGGVGKELNQD